MRTRFNWGPLWPKGYASAAMMHDQSSTILNQLREVRATLAGHTARFDRVEERVDRLDEQLRDLHLLLAGALEHGAADRLRSRNADEGRPEASATSQTAPGRQEEQTGDRPVGRLEQRVSDIERRLATVEEQLDCQAGAAVLLSGP